jgi:hypothetical protein
VAVAAHVAAGLVLIAGAAKVIRPTATSDALALSRVPAATHLVRLLGAGELALALVVFAVGGRLAFAALSLAYAGFVVVAARQQRAGRGCGCFGAPTATVGPLHLVTDVVATVIAAAAAVLVVPSLPQMLPVGTVAAGVSLLLGVTAVVLGQALLTSLPELLAARALVATGYDR